MGIDFGNLIRRSFEIAWKYKSLWVFGLFAGGFGSFNTNWTDKINQQVTDQGTVYNWPGQFGFPSEAIPSSMAVWSAIILWVLALVLLFFICHLIAQPAIIDAVNKITRGGQYTWGTSFSRGADFFWRFFGLYMVELFVFAAIVAPVVLLAWLVSLVTLLLTIPAAIVLAFCVFYTFGLAEVAMVARDSAVADAIIEGWNLFMQNKLNCFLMFLVSIGMWLGFLIVFGIIAAILYLPINLLVIAMTENLAAVFMLALFIGLPVALVIGGYIGTFFNALYVQFYFRLVEPPRVAAVTTGPMA
jgi:hypothetical protein